MVSVLPAATAAPAPERGPIGSAAGSTASTILVQSSVPGQRCFLELRWDRRPGVLGSSGSEALDGWLGEFAARARMRIRLGFVPGVVAKDPIGQVARAFGTGIQRLARPSASSRVGDVTLGLGSTFVHVTVEFSAPTPRFVSDLPRRAPSARFLSAVARGAGLAFTQRTLRCGSIPEAERATFAAFGRAVVVAVNPLRVIGSLVPCLGGSDEGRGSVREPTSGPSSPGASTGVKVLVASRPLLRALEDDPSTALARAPTARSNPPRDGPSQ